MPVPTKTPRLRYRPLFNRQLHVFLVTYIPHICDKMARWHRISIPENIHKAMCEIVESEGSLYTCVSDLAKDALRTKIELIRSQNREWK